mgnify:FL=1
MSRILRRPMFRGGPVSSYGTGIASGLTDTSKPKRGLVDEPGGYAGVSMSGLSNYADIFGGSGTGTGSSSGAGIVEAAKNRTLSSPNIFQRDFVKAKNLPVVGKAIRPLFGGLGGGATLASGGAGLFGAGAGAGIGIGQLADFYAKSTYTPEGYKRLKESGGANFNFDETNPDVGEIFEYIDEGNQIGEAPGFFPQGGKRKFFEDKGLDPETGLTIESKNNDELPEGEIKNLNTNVNTKENNLNINNPEEPEITAKDAIKENQELFADLLGKSKARGLDISDMLASASASFLGTGGVKEGFAEFMANQAKAGPSRTEKINEAAAALAIKDYAAGKRAKEQAEIYKGKIDYEYGKKGELANVQMGDDVQTALFKVGKLGDINPNSDTAFKYLIEMKTGTNQVFRENKIKMKDLGKPNKIKKLKTGFNIIEEDGVKNIILYDGKGDPSTIQVFSIGELWNS